VVGDRILVGDIVVKVQNTVRSGKPLVATSFLITSISHLPPIFNRVLRRFLELSSLFPAVLFIKDANPEQLSDNIWIHIL
jgi:hypothetical protein